MPSEDMVKIVPKKSEGVTALSSEEVKPQYPYGTELRLENDLVEQLGVGELEAGEIVEVRGIAFVERKSENISDDVDNGKKTNKDISFQLTSLSLVQSSKDKVAKLYPGN